jgi:hypothetical protein
MKGFENGAYSNCWGTWSGKNTGSNLLGMEQLLLQKKKDLLKL